MKKSDKIKELELKIAKMKSGLSSEHISEQMKESIKKSIKLAEEQLSELTPVKPVKTPRPPKANLHLMSLKPEDVFSGWGATGISYSDRTKEEHGDYKKIAHVSSTDGGITWYVPDPDKNLPEWLLKDIRNEHLRLQVGRHYSNIMDLSDKHRRGRITDSQFKNSTSAILAEVKKIEEENGVSFDELYVNVSDYLPIGFPKTREPEKPGPPALKAKNKSGFTKEQYQGFRERYDALSDQYSDYVDPSPGLTRLKEEMHELENKISAYERNYKYRPIPMPSDNKMKLEFIDSGKTVMVYNTHNKTDETKELIASLSKSTASSGKNLGKITYKFTRKSLPEIYNSEIEYYAKKMKDDFLKSKQQPSYKLLTLLSDPENILPSKLSVIAEKADWLWENTTDENPNHSIILFALKHNKYFRKKFSDHYKLELSDEQILAEIDLLFEIICTVPSSIKTTINLELIQQLHKFFLKALLKSFIPSSQLRVMEKTHQTESRDIAKLILGTPVVREGTDTFHLHYFSSSSDVFIKEVDYGTGMQDYGYSVLNQDWEMSEYGYVSISELLTIPDMNLDLHFTPKQLPEIRYFYDTDSRSRAAAHSKDLDKDKYAKVIEKLSKSALCQILIDFGNNIEIYDMSEVIDFDSHIYHITFNLHRPQLDISAEHELQYKLDIDESGSYFIPLSGNIFTLPTSFNIGKFIKENLQQLDSRSQNTIYSFSKFLTDHSEELIGKKVAAKTFKRLEESEQKTLKTAYNEKLSAQKTPKTKSPEDSRRSRLRLTKFLKAHGVTQTMIDEINKTGEGQVIKKSEIPKAGSKHDKARLAMLPGKRLSSDGNIYYEYRIDRADSGKNGL